MLGNWVNGRRILLVLAALISIVSLTGCGGGVSTPRTGTIELNFVDASAPNASNLALTGKITVGGQTAELQGSQPQSFSNLAYGTYSIQAAIDGYAARPLQVKLSKPVVSADLVLVPLDDNTPPQVVETTVIQANEYETLLGLESFRLDGFKVTFSEYIEPVPDQAVLEITSGTDSKILGPDDWQISQNMLTFSPSQSWDSGTQSFPMNWQSGTTYTIAIQGVRDYAGNDLLDYFFTLTGSSDQQPPDTPNGLSGQSTEAGQEILIQWDSAASLDLWGYQVYRKRQDESVFQLLNETPITETSLLNTNLTNGVIYDYLVKAVDLNGLISPASAVVSATPASPNRGIIAFASDRQSLTDGIPDFNLYLKFYQSPSSSEEVEITGLVPYGAESNEDCPAWAPDGRRLAYTSTNNANNPELYIADLRVDHNSIDTVFSAEADNIRQLTFTEATEASPAWSPDGQSLIWVEYPGTTADSTESRLMLAELSGGFPQTLVDNGKRNEEPDWRPQGDKVVFCTEGEGPEGFWEIQLLDLKTLTTSAIVPDIATPGDDRDPAFSPDGTKIAFSSTRGYVDSYYQYANIWVMDLDGSNAFKVTTESGVTDSAPVWSPDGGELIFTREDSGPAAIYRVAAQEGATPQLIAQSPGDQILGVPAARNWLPSCAK